MIILSSARERAHQILSALNLVYRAPDYSAAIGALLSITRALYSRFFPRAAYLAHPLEMLLWPKKPDRNDCMCTIVFFTMCPDSVDQCQKIVFWIACEPHDKLRDHISGILN